MTLTSECDESNEFPVNEERTYASPVQSKGSLTPGLGEQSGVLKDSTVKVYLGYRNININIIEKKTIIRTPLCRHPGLECSVPCRARTDITAPPSSCIIFVPDPSLI